MTVSRVGILTFHYAHNYGAMLQAYALKTFLSGQGYNVNIINYVPDYMRMKYFHMGALRVFATCKRSIIKGYFKQYKNIKRFELFEKQFLNVNPKRLLLKSNLAVLDREYDTFIFGSDQVWNTFITKNDMSYFGDFSLAGDKISYAASLGNAMTSEDYDQIVCKYISGYKAISVREKSAQDFLRKLLGRDVFCVLDPVFLLSVESWNKLAQESTVALKERYILYYTVQDNSVLADESNRYARKNGLKIYAVHGEMRRSNSEAVLLSGIGPLEFLSLIKNADVVFTNSFHAVAFSIIFNKHAFFRVHSETSNRVVDLLKMCGCDWDGTGLYEKDRDLFDKLSNMVSDSQNFLKSNLRMDK